MKVLVKPEVLPDEEELLYEAYGCDRTCDCMCKCDIRSIASDEDTDEILF